MSRQYLTAARIADFRTYGKDFFITFPEGPSLTVVCGMNGLGKTTLFDALEWALLGDIQRFQHQHLSEVISPLTRKGAPQNSHQVELQWGDDTVLRTHRLAPDAEVLRRVLVDPQWGPGVQDLSVYLRLTHFLPQSSGQRFLKKEEKEKWGLLKGPTGVERLERFRRLLDDIKARNAFDRRIQQLKLLQQNALQDRDNWHQYLSQQKNWSNLAEAASAMSPEQVDVWLAQANLPFSIETPSSEKDVAKRLLAARQETNRAIQHSEERTSRLSIQEKAIPRYRQLAQQAEAVRLMVLAQDGKIKQAEAERSEIAAQIDPEKRLLAQIEEKRSGYVARSLQLLAIIEALQQKDQLQREAANLVARVNNLTEDEKKIRKELAARTELLNRHEKLVQQAAMLRERIANVEHLRLQAKEAAAGEIEANQHRTVIAKLEKEQADLLAKQPSLDHALAKAEDALREARVKVDHAKKVYDVITDARATVVGAIGPDDNICPICAHQHPPGELLRQARNRLELTSHSLGAVLDELKKAEGARDAARGLRDTAKLQLAELTARLETQRVRLEHSEKQKKTLMPHAMLTEVKFAEAEGKLRELHGRLTVQLEQANQSITNAKPPADFNKTGEILHRSLEAAVAELKQCEEKQKSLVREIELIDMKLQSHQTLIMECGGPAELNQARNALLRQSADAEKEITSRKEKITQLQNRLAAAEKAVADLRAHLGTQKQTLDSYEKEMDALARAWRKAELDGLPATDVLAAERTKVGQALAVHQRLIDQLTAAAQGLESWNNRQELARVTQALDEIRKRMKASSDADCSKKLEKAALEAATRLQQTISARERASGFASMLLRRSGEFSQAALDPLSARITGFHQLISPFKYEVELKPHLTETMGKARTKLVVPNLQGSKSTTEDPDLWLSEGQASALGLSVLLGASTVYPWSNWRALLLDDPLQNTDLIHAAAFGDVLRSLMKDEGYQVIVSTHNPDEADFLLRKVRRAGLPVQRLELISLAPDGVKFELRED